MKKFIIISISMLFVTPLLASEGATTCLIFIHGMQADKNTKAKYSAARGVWVSHKRDFIKTATKKFQSPYYVVGYDGTRSYHEGSLDVARQIIRAVNGKPDGGGKDCKESERFIVIAHSMGNTIMDFILGNSRASDPNFNYKGAPFDQVANSIEYVVSLSGAHRGSQLADAVCLDHPSQICKLEGIIARIFAKCNDDSSSAWWLRSSDEVQVHKYSNSPARPIYLTGGDVYQIYPSDYCLSKLNDHVVQFASQYACKGSSSTRFEKATVCDSYNKQEPVGFYNIDTAWEAHWEINKDTSREARWSIPSSVLWREAKAGKKVARNKSTAQLTAEYLVDQLKQNLEASGDKITNPLAQHSSEFAQKARRYPQSNQALSKKMEDPILKEDRAQPITVWSSKKNQDTPLALSVWNSDVSYESTEPITLFAQGLNGQLTSVSGEIVDDQGKTVGELNFKKSDSKETRNNLWTTEILPKNIIVQEIPELARTYLVRYTGTFIDGTVLNAVGGFLLSNPWSQLTGRYKDFIINGNLVIRAELKVLKKGRFHLAGTLYGQNDEPIGTAQNAVVLQPGVQWIDLNWHGLLLRDRGIPGPFKLGTVQLRTTGKVPNALNALVRNAHTTKFLPLNSLSDKPYTPPRSIESR